MKSYKTYDPIDFAQDASFIRWVLGKSSKDRIFWENWIRSHPEKTTDIEEAKTLVKAIRFDLPEPDQKQIDGLWDRIEQETSEKSSSKVIVFNRRRWIAAAAAAILILLTIPLLLPDASNSVRTANAEWRSHELPDQSIVMLNALSRIDYSAEEWDEERLIKLQGEAFFKVQKGERFIVTTELGSVEVLGTSFNVFARPGQLEVHCFTGQVKVTSEVGQSTVLTPGKSATLDRDQLTISDEENQAVPTWMDGVFYYEENVVYRKVFDEIERQFNVRINTDKIEAQDLYTGSFDRNSGLDTVLNEVCFTHNWTYEKNGDQIIIRKK